MNDGIFFHAYKRRARGGGKCTVGRYIKKRGTSVMQRDDPSDNESIHRCMPLLASKLAISLAPSHVSPSVSSVDMADRRRSHIAYHSLSSITFVNGSYSRPHVHEYNSSYSKRGKQIIQDRSKQNVNNLTKLLLLLQHQLGNTRKTEAYIYVHST